MTPTQALKRIPLWELTGQPRGSSGGGACGTEAKSG